MGKSIVSTKAAVDGIEIENPLDLLVAETSGDWVEIVSRILRDGLLPFRSERNREFVMRRYGWDNSLRRLGALLEWI